jgi:hypothetical protein
LTLALIKFTFFHKLLILFHKESYVKQDKFEDTKGIIGICKSKDRQHNGQKKKDERTNNDLQNITQKTKDRVTRTPLKTGGELRFSGWVNSSCIILDYQSKTI